jgi:hypothetical protein
MFGSSATTLPSVPITDLTAAAAPRGHAAERASGDDN